MSIRAQPIVYALVVLLKTAVSRADLLPVVNGSFESPATGFVTTTVDDWTIDGPPNSRIVGIFTNNSTPVGSPAHITNAIGTQLIFLGTESGNEITQSIPGSFFEAGSAYVLSTGI